MNKTVWLIRHGESEANAGRYSTAPDSIPITAKGREQAELLARYFPHSPSLIVVSPFLRTQQTARPLIERFGSIPVETWNVEEFTYLSPAKCGVSTMADRRPRVLEFWKRCEVDYCDGEGAETFTNFVGRIRQTIERLKTSEHREIAFFSHGQFIRVMLWLILTRTETINNHEMRRISAFLDAMPFPNTAFVKLKFVENECCISPVLTDHLPPELISY